MSELSLNSPLARLLVGVLILSHLGFAFYIYKDETFPLKQRIFFVIGALFTGPFLFGKIYFKKAEKHHRQQLNRQHREYARSRRGENAE